MSTRSNLLVLAAIGAASLCVSPAASAQPSVREIVVIARGDAEVKAEKVSYADLNIDSQAGADTFLHRLNGAAERVCGPEPTSHEPTQAFKKCVASAVDHAVADIDRPTLTALGRRGG